MPSNPRKSKWYSTRTANRHRKAITVTVSPECVERLTELAEIRCQPKSVVVETLILNAPDTDEET